MDFAKGSSPSSSSSPNFVFDKNIIIVILLFILVLSFLGINLLTILGNWVNNIMSLLGPFLTSVLSLFGYTLGSTINVTTDVTTNVAKTGVDIAGGSFHSIGDVLKKASSNNVDPNVKNTLDHGSSTPPPPPPPPPAKKEGFSRSQFEPFSQDPILGAPYGSESTPLIQSRSLISAK